jgi:hypothetical protein
MPERSLGSLFDRFKLPSREQTKTKCVYVDQEMHRLLKGYAKHRNVYLSDLLEYLVKLGLTTEMVLKERKLKREVKTLDDIEAFQDNFLAVFGKMQSKGNEKGASNGFSVEK